MSLYPSNFPLHAPLALFNSLVRGHRNMPTPSLVKILESELHRHHMHLSSQPIESLSTFLIAFIFSLHMSDAYRDELRIRRSYLFPDYNDQQLVLITIKENPMLVGELEIRPFIFQTNPIEGNFRKQISDAMLVKVRDQLMSDNLAYLYDQLLKSEIGIIEIERPKESRFRFWNAHGQEMVSEDAKTAPFKVYAYLTQFDQMPTEDQATSSADILTLIPGELPELDIRRLDFQPDPKTNRIRFVEIMSSLVQLVQEKFPSFLSDDAFARFMAGFTMGLKTKYKLAVSSRVSLDRSENLDEISFLLDDRQTTMTITELFVSSAPVLITFGDNFEADKTKRKAIPEDIQMLTGAKHFFWLWVNKEPIDSNEALKDSVRV